jgi:hypothetical protein
LAAFKKLGSLQGYYYLCIWRERLIYRKCAKDAKDAKDAV